MSLQMGECAGREKEDSRRMIKSVNAIKLSRKGFGDVTEG
jgi:hypothetical protein